MEMCLSHFDYWAQNFESFEYDPFGNSGNVFFDNSSDLDLHFFNTNIQNIITAYILPREFCRQL